METTQSAWKHILTPLSNFLGSSSDVAAQITELRIVEIAPIVDHAANLALYYSRVHPAKMVVAKDAVDLYAASAGGIDSMYTTLKQKYGEDVGPPPPSLPKLELGSILFNSRIRKVSFFVRRAEPASRITVNQCWLDSFAKELPSQELSSFQVLFGPRIEFDPITLRLEEGTTTTDDVRTEFSVHFNDGNSSHLPQLMVAPQCTVAPHSKRSICLTVDEIPQATVPFTIATRSSLLLAHLFAEEEDQQEAALMSFNQAKDNDISPLDEELETFQGMTHLNKDDAVMVPKEETTAVPVLLDLPVRQKAFGAVVEFMHLTSEGEASDSASLEGGGGQSHLVLFTNSHTEFAEKHLLKDSSSLDDVLLATFELLDLGAFLNMPALKRFIRSFLVLLLMSCCEIAGRLE